MRLIPVPAFDDNYLWLAVDGDGAAVAVDPGAAEPVLAALDAHALTLRAILVTHHHNDHIGGVADIVARHRVPVYAPDDERIALATARVHDGDRVGIDGFAASFDVIATPGHTRSHVSYVGDGALFCGDTLFSVGCGRLFEGTPGQMLASLERLAALPPETAVCCAHEYTLSNCAYADTIEPGNAALRQRIANVRTLRAQVRPSLPSTLALEAATNPFLRVDAPDVVDWGMRTHGIAAADRVARFAALRSGKDQFRTPASW
ncbi:hydroxyacylglutathione hydrolase [Tahibacter soli]|uniref:Hydroxyacylglutathione hydrolase n=1 Tax=Tahibacter soli TaxID=2983605 RepID=A0A9X4BJR3_9GAMM|nr:hydroxyacylglutathione hydrolase [Tahibacter soli]MDC8015371.1 hydroxyacylglutathione hydrolase [Tahibacter soli]